MARRVRPGRHGEALPLVALGPDPRLAGAPLDVRRDALRGRRRRRAPAVLRGDHTCAGLALGVAPPAGDEAARRPEPVPRRAFRPRNRPRGHQTPADRGAPARQRRRADDHVQRVGVLHRLRDGVPAAEPDRLPAAARSRARLRQGRPPRPAINRRDDSGHGARADADGDRRTSSTRASSCRRRTRSPTASSRMPRAGSSRPTRRSTKPTFTGSGRPSARSSCTSTASRSAAAPT